MRRLFAILSFLISAGAGQAQDRPPFIVGPPPPPLLGSSEVGNYCVFENLVYSVGSPLCVGKMGYICNPTKGTSGFNERGFWTTKPTDPALTPPGCQ